MDSFLQGADVATQQWMLLTYAQFVRDGNAGRGHVVRLGSVQAAIGAVGKIFSLEHPDRVNPCHAVGQHERYFPALAELMRGYERDDPKAQPKLAVPVAVTKHVLAEAKTTTSKHRNKIQAVADLITIAFYFLLRVGEYTYKPGETQTVPFHVGHITFRTADSMAIPQDANLATLHTAVEATMRITNQKSGIKGQCIHVEALRNDPTNCPIRALARRVHHILSKGGSLDSPIYEYYNQRNVPSKVGSALINTTVKDAAMDIGLDKHGYTRADVSSHSLRAGGAMAMHLNGISATTIQMTGRWSANSNTFLTYIHEQISAFAAGVSERMSNSIQFRHIAGPTVQMSAATA